MKHIAVIGLLVFCGCGKKPAPAPVITEQVEPPTAAAPAPIPAAPPVAPVATPKAPVALEDQLQGTIHPEMTMRLQMFLQMRGRMPESFYELQNVSGFDSTPGLPPTMKYVIDPKDKTVKIVKK